MNLRIFILLAAMLSNSDKNTGEQYIRVEKGGIYNPLLSYVHPPDGWTGNKVNSKNQFQNIDTIQMPSFGDVLRWKLKKNPQKKEKIEEKYVSEVIKDSSFLNREDDVIVWLGHSTFFIRVNGISLMTDPVFYDVPLVKRHHELPFNPKLIANLHYILISHNHRDHCDKKSLKLLSEHNPQAVILAGLEMDKLLKKWIPNKVQAAGWFQKYQTPNNVQIVFLPAQHWSKRGLTDTNERLWGSFSIKLGNKSFYFGGDTGWGSHFAYIGKNFGPFDACLLPIGAYSPRWFMKPSHINPEEAISAFKNLNAEILFPMHFGTYDLSDEPLGEPGRLLKNEFYKNYGKQRLSCLSVGQVKAI